MDEEEAGNDTLEKEVELLKEAVVTAEVSNSAQNSAVSRMAVLTALRPVITHLRVRGGKVEESEWVHAHRNALEACPSILDRYLVWLNSQNTTEAERVGVTQLVEDLSDRVHDLLQLDRDHLEVALFHQPYAGPTDVRLIQTLRKIRISYMLQKLCWTCTLFAGMMIIVAYYLTVGILFFFVAVMLLVFTAGPLKDI